MQIIRDIDFLPESLRGGAVSLGKFDGLHLGHSLILKRLKEHANRRNIPSIVFTFEPSPVSVLRPDLEIKPICSLSRKIELIRSFHVDALLVVHTTNDFLLQDAETFFFETLIRKMNAQVLVEGESFTFGKNRSGNARTVTDFGRQAGIEVDIVQPIRLGNHSVSSSGIRELLKTGQVEQANELLIQPFRLQGTVVHGEHRGRTLGFPTANLGDIETILPKPGIYSTAAWIDGRRHIATTHIGANPTFHETPIKIEVFVHHFSGDLYGQTLDVDFLAHLRDIVRFNSVDELLRQMNLDIRQSERIAGEGGRAEAGR